MFVFPSHPFSAVTVILIQGTLLPTSAWTSAHACADKRRKTMQMYGYLYNFFTKLLKFLTILCNPYEKVGVGNMPHFEHFHTILLYEGIETVVKICIFVTEKR